MKNTVLKKIMAIIMFVSLLLDVGNVIVFADNEVKSEETEVYEAVPEETELPFFEEDITKIYEAEIENETEEKKEIEPEDIEEITEYVENINKWLNQK